MEALRDKDNFLIYEGYKIELGIKDGVGSGWFIYSEDGNVCAFINNGNYEVVEFDLTDKPSDYEPKKYRYVNGKFEPNGDWIPEKSIKELINELTQRINTVSENLTNQYLEIKSRLDATSNVAEEAQEALCDIDKTYNQRFSEIEDALCELSKMVGG